MSENSVKLFISYSHSDEMLRRQLDKHLAPLKGQKIIEEWHDRQIEAGAEWANQIDAKLNKADIVLLLISPDFVASDYCSKIELAQAVNRHENGEAIVVPVILEPCDWSWLPFAKFQALPKNGKAITKWANQNEAFLDVATGLREVAEELFAKRQQKALQLQAAREDYKTKVERALSVSPGGKISVADQDTLDERREELGLTKEDAAAILDQAFRPFKDREEKLRKYRKTAVRYIVNGDYPFSDEIKRQLENRQRDLGIKAEDLERFMQPILAQADAIYRERLKAKEVERHRQLDLATETQRQLELEHQTTYAKKLRQYEEEFSKAVRAIYPLSESAWSGIHAFQQSLGLNDEDVERTEKLILADAETKNQERLQAQAAERQRKSELVAEEQKRLELEQAEYENKLQLYEQVFSNAIAAQYPIGESDQAELNRLRQAMELHEEDVTQIERQLIASKEAEYQQQQTELAPHKQEKRPQELDQQNLALEAEANSQQAQQEKQAEAATQKTKPPEGTDQKDADAKADAVIATMVSTVIGAAVIPAYINWSITATIMGAGVVAIGRCYGIELTKDEGWHLVKDFILGAGLWFAGLVLGSRIISMLLTSTGVGYAGAVAMDAAVSAALACAIGESAKMYFKGERDKGKLGKTFRSKFRSAKQEINQKNKNM